MKFFIALSFFFVFAATQATYAAAKKICVVNFERPLAPQSRIVEQVFGDQPGVTVRTLAIPLDIARCIQEKAEEIIIIGHAMLTPSNRDGDRPVNLGFFMNLEGTPRKQAIETWLGQIQSEIGRISPFGKNYSDAQIQKSFRRLQRQRQELNHFTDDKPFYVLRPVLPQALRVARHALEAQAREPQGVTLKKIRLLACLPDQILSQYDDLRAMIAENTIELDIAPKNVFWSYVKGMTVTSPDKEWLRQSL